MSFVSITIFSSYTTTWCLVSVADKSPSSMQTAGNHGKLLVTEAITSLSVQHTQCKHFYHLPTD